jgi:rod shape-determining protein MreC
MLSGSSKTHQAFFASTANEVTGSINKKYYGFREYFSLRETNKQLAIENAMLRNQLKANFDVPDTSSIVQIDSLVTDSLNRYRKFTFLPAKVVGNTVTSNTNYIMLERGSKQGVTKDMSVIAPQGIVGVVVEVSENYSKVMSLLHKFSKVSAMLKNGNTSGDVEWDGNDPHFVTMRKVSKGAKVAIGDTVLTSTYSANFPSNIMVGTVAEIKPDPAASFYNLKVKTATNFFNLQYVYLVQNIRFTEQNELAKKKDTKINE